jgi:biotin carboxylase
MRPPPSQKRRYLLVFGATMALKERAIAAAIRVFDGPLVTIERTVNTRSAKLFDHILVADFSDPDSALRATRNFEEHSGMTPAAVIPFFDPGLRPGRAIADYYGVAFLTRSAVEDSSINKSRMKDRLLQAGVATPRYQLVDGAEATHRAVAKFGLPCVIKPSAFGGSLGVRLISDEDQIADSYAYVQKLIDDHAAVFTVRNRAVQVEEFCALADEVSVEVLNHHDYRAVLAVTDKSLGPRPYFAEIGHRVPSVYSMRDDVADLAMRACAAIGLDRGVAHVEMRLEADKAPQIMEVGARTAGDGILDLVESALGFSAYELHIRSYLDQLDIGELDRTLSAVQPLGVAAIAVLKAPVGRIADILAPNAVDSAVRNYEVFAAPGSVSSSGQQNYLDREGYVECFWPGASATSIPRGRHLEIAQQLAGQVFAMAEEEHAHATTPV